MLVDDGESTGAKVCLYFGLYGIYVDHLSVTDVPVDVEAILEFSFSLCCEKVGSRTCCGCVEFGEV